MSRGAFVVSLHDVSPHTYAACVQIIDELAAIGVPTTSLLVIPDHHHRGHLLDSPECCSWLKRLTSEGHEAVIHGYYHRRERRETESTVAKLTTRVYTADEGEFFDISQDGARALVEKGRGEFHQIGLQPSGFIAPAWLLSSEGEQALRALGIQYTTRLASVLDLQSGSLTRSQSLVWSVRSGWRRVTSLLWNATLSRQLRSNPLLRISIHPVDIRHPAIWSQILQLASRAVATRDCLTYQGWITSRR